MKRKNLYITLLIYFCITANQILAQPITIKQDFVPILDSMVMPPSNCVEADKLTMPDSAGDEFAFNTLLTDQNERIQKLFDELTTLAKNNDHKKYIIPQRKNTPPPSGFPPVGDPGDFQDDIGAMREDMEDAYGAVDKLNTIREKFKNDLNMLETNVNEKLHKTLASDHAAHINIVNEFLKAGTELYKKNFRAMRENMLKIDDITKKFDYGVNLQLPRIKSEILNLQVAQITNLKFLMNVIKEFVNIGTEFYS